MKGNCKCHLIHNTLKNANRFFSATGYDAEAIVLKIHSEFSCSAKRADSLKEFCEFMQYSIKKYLGMFQPVGYLCCLQFSGSWSVGLPESATFCHWERRTVLTLFGGLCAKVLLMLPPTAAMRMRWQCFSVSCCSFTISCKSFTAPFWSWKMRVLCCYPFGWYAGTNDQLQRERDVFPLLQSSSLPFVSDEFEKNGRQKESSFVYHTGYFPRTGNHGCDFPETVPESRGRR